MQSIHLEERATQIISSPTTRLALAARHEKSAGDGLSDVETGMTQPITKFGNDTTDLMPQDGWHREIDRSTQDVQVRVTQTTGSDLEKNLAMTGSRNIEGFDDERLTGLPQHRGTHGCW